MRFDILILIFIWKCERLKITKTTLEKRKNKPEGLILPDFKAYFKATITVTACHRDRD